MSPAAKPGGAGAVDVIPAAMAASKLGMMEKLLAAIEKQPSLAQARDGEGKSGASPDITHMCRRFKGV